MTRTIFSRDDKQFATHLEKQGALWFVLLEGDSISAKLPLTQFIVSLLAKKPQKDVPHERI